MPTSKYVFSPYFIIHDGWLELHIMYHGLWHEFSTSNVITKRCDSWHTTCMRQHICDHHKNDYWTMVVFANDALATAGVAVIFTLFRLSAGIITAFSKSKQTKEDNAADDTVGNDITTNTTYFSKIIWFIKYCLQFCYLSATDTKSNGEDDDDSPLLRSKPSSLLQGGSYGTIIDDGNTK